MQFERFNDWQRANDADSVCTLSTSEQWHHIRSLWATVSQRVMSRASGSPAGCATRPHLNAEFVRGEVLVTVSPAATHALSSLLAPHPAQGTRPYGNCPANGSHCTLLLTSILFRHALYRQTAC